MGLAGTLDHVWPVLKAIAFGIHAQNDAAWNEKNKEISTFVCFAFVIITMNECILWVSYKAVEGLGTI